VTTLVLMRRDYDQIFKLAAEYHHERGLTWLHLKAQCAAESLLNPNAVSPAGAVGIAQFLPSTLEEVMGPHADPKDPLQSIWGQAKYMNIWLPRILAKKARVTQPEWYALLAAYNWGPGNMSRCMRLRGPRSRWQEWIKYVPRETQDYINRCGLYHAELEALERA
jgi:soluble lytic murein transglycosylase-like protein